MSDDRITGTFGSRLGGAAAFLRPTRVLLRAGLASFASVDALGESFEALSLDSALSCPNSLRMSFLITCIEEVQNAPALRLRVRAQGVVRIRGDRVRDAFEQRDVVVRVAVKISALEVAKRLAERREPLLHAHDLAFAIARGAAWTASECALRMIVHGF